MLAQRVQFLTGYQNAAYAAEYQAFVEKVRAAESRLGTKTPLTEAVARYLFKLMAYKDEYEVARLYLLPESRRRAALVGGHRTRVTYHLHPPVLRALGLRRKLAIRTGARTMFRVLRLMRPLRGTLLDPFAYARLRRLEREMVVDYELAISRLVDRLATGSRSAADVDEAVAIASLPDRVRGYEHLKLERALAFRDELTRRIDAFAG